MIWLLAVGIVLLVVGVALAALAARSRAGPTPQPPPPAGSLVVELRNGTGVRLLAGALGPTPVLPREGRWDFGPGETLTIVVPESWKHTAPPAPAGALADGPRPPGPRFWVRTGCSFDAAADKAQCETGDCGGRYDCSKAGLAGVAPVSLAEFCFECGGGLTYYDVSLVDGYTVSVDIEPLAPYSPAHPGQPGDALWCKSGMCLAGRDLRADCPDAFALKRSAAGNYVAGTPGGDAVVACFSNCGRYEYPTAPAAACPDSDPKCAAWRRYCCQAASYGRKCATDADCTDGGACWGGVCSCRAYYKAPCDPSVCTGPSAQPAPGQCGTDCVGDDVVHAACPRAYSWPNDPQTYNCDAAGYRITFGPGWGSMPVTPPGPIPRAADLPAAHYDAARARQLCGRVGTFGCAKTRESGQNWDCNVDAAACNGVLVRW